MIENLQNDSSNQRDLERELFEQPLIFYTSKGNLIENITKTPNHIELTDPWMDDVKFNLFTENETTIFVRFFNFRDEFDNLTDKERNPKIDVEAFGRNIWKLTNNVELDNISVTEVSLNHLQPKEKESKTKWPTKKPIRENNPNYQNEETGNSNYLDIYIVLGIVIIHPQRFRAFKLSYIS